MFQSTSLHGLVGSWWWRNPSIANCTIIEGGLYLIAENRALRLWLVFCLGGCFFFRLFFCCCFVLHISSIRIRSFPARWVPNLIEETAQTSSRHGRFLLRRGWNHRFIFWLNTCSTGNTESNNLMVGQPTFGWWSWSDWHFKVSELRLTINVLFQRHARNQCC